MEGSMDKQLIREIPVIKISQWLKDWDDVLFSDSDHRRKPEPYFYFFSIPAKDLRRLSTVYERKANQPRAQDMSIQRAHEANRSEEISRYVHGGYPWSDLSNKRKESSEYKDLRMPGWLPTAIVVNILAPNSKRGNSTILDKDLIKIRGNEGTSANIILPDGFENHGWAPTIPPIEIIDGQHRVYSFDPFDDMNGSFELPVVAFYNLDFTWQAYLFYTINIRPKKINTSLAYDLYPLLRIQDWLEKFPDGPIIYRETRAQELTEVLWSHPLSPWKDRINMLGEKKMGDVTQAAFIRSLTTSFVKKGTDVGGLFGSELHKGKNDILPWGRVRQAAFLIMLWECMREAVFHSREGWAENLRQITDKNQLPLIKPEREVDVAFSGSNSLLATDQGVRGFLQITNDMCFVASDVIGLSNWDVPGLIEDDIDSSQITLAIKSLEKEPCYLFIKAICEELTKFDWRTSSTPGLDDARRRAQMIFKGSSGYKELRTQLIDLLRLSNDQLIKKTAQQL